MPNPYVRQPQPGGGIRRPGAQQPQPGQSWTPERGQIMPRRGMEQQGGNADTLRRQLAKLMSDLAMAQANGASPRHVAEIQGRIYQLQLEIQIAQEKENGIADWLSQMMSSVRSHTTRPYDNVGGGG